MQEVTLVSKFTVIVNIYCKYVWVVPLKYKKGITVVKDFQEIFCESGHKQNEIWVDEDNEFCNRSVKS